MIYTKRLWSSWIFVSLVGFYTTVAQFDPKFEPNQVYCKYGDSYHSVGDTWMTACNEYNCTKEGVVQIRRTVSCPLFERSKEIPQQCGNWEMLPTDSTDCCGEQIFCQSLPPKVLYECSEGWLKMEIPSAPDFQGDRYACVRVYSEGVTWREARKLCRENSAWLIDWSRLGSVNREGVEPSQFQSLYDQIPEGKDYWHGLYVTPRMTLAADSKTITPVFTEDLCNASPRSYLVAGWGCDRDEQWTDPPQDLCFSARLHPSHSRNDSSFKDLNPYNQSIYQTSLCEDKKPFICALYDDDIDFTIYSDSSLCPVGWLWSPFARTCLFYTESGISLNFISASFDCIDKGGLLFNPDTPEKQHLLYNIMNSRDPKPATVWITAPGSEDKPLCMTHQNPYMLDKETMRQEADHMIAGASCLQSLPFICERPEDRTRLAPPNVTLSAENLSPADAVQLNQRVRLSCKSSDPAADLKLSNLMQPTQISFLNQDTLVDLGGSNPDTTGNYQCAVYSPEQREIVYSNHWSHQRKDVLNLVAAFVMTDIPYSGVYSWISYSYLRSDQSTTNSWSLSEGDSLSYDSIYTTLSKVIDEAQSIAVQTILNGTSDVVMEQMVSTTKITAIRNREGKVELDAYITFYAPTPQNSEEDEDPMTERRRKRQAIDGLINQGAPFDVFTEVFEPSLNAVLGDGSNLIVLPTDKCGDRTLMVPILDVTIRLPSGKPGEVITYSMCGSTGQPLVHAECTDTRSVGLIWRPSFNDCPSLTERTKQLARVSLMEVTADTYQKMAALVNSLTSDIADLGVDDITYTAEILHSLIRSPLRAASRDDLNAFLMSVTQTISNIVMSNSSAVLQAQTTAKSSERTLFAIGNITQVILSANNTDVEFETVASGLSYRLTKESQISGVLSLEAELNEDTVVYVNEKSSNYSLINNDKVVGLFLKKELARTSRKGFALYSNVNLFRRQRSADEGSGLRSGGRVVSATMVDESGQLISEIMGGVYQDLEYDSSPPVCGFWDLDLGDWSTDGCLTAENGGDVVCSCNHLTDFSVLLDVNRQAVVDGADDIHRQVLSIISIVGLSISIATLSLVILTAMIYRRLRKNDSQKVLVCLALSLFGLNVTFLVGVSQRGEGASCIAAAVIIHYFLLTSFAWMLVEAIIQYLRFVKVLGTYIPKFMLKVTLSAFLAPLAIIIVVLAVDYKLYISEDSDVCWMKREAIYYSVLIPVGLVIIINTIVFIMVIHGLTCRRSNVRSNQSERKLALLHFKASLAIFIILGITWVFGLLALIPDSTIAFQYMFCIFNCFQGLLIFIFHYAREPTVRQEWRSIFRRIKLSSSGGKSTVSTNQPNSNSIPSQSKPADQTNNMNTKSNPYKPDWLNGNNKEEEL